MHGQVGDLAADLVDRAARLGLDVAAGLLHHLLAPLGGLGLGVALVDLGRLARAIDDLLGLLAGLGQALAVLGQQLVGLLARALGGVDRVLDRPLAPVQGLGDAREGQLGQHVHRDHEQHQRPDHQPDVGGDQERPAGGDAVSYRGAIYLSTQASRPATSP